MEYDRISTKIRSHDWLLLILVIGKMEKESDREQKVVSVFIFLG